MAAGTVALAGTRLRGLRACAALREFYAHCALPCLLFAAIVETADWTVAGSEGAGIVTPECPG